MTIDPSIIAGLRQVQIQQPDPLEQYGKALTLKGLLGQQELQGLQTQQARQGVEDDAATRSAYQNAGGDNARLRSLLQSSGQYKAIQALDKFNLETDEKRSTINRNNQETLAKAIAQHRDQLANVNDPQTMAQWVASAYQDPVLAPVVSKGGTLEQALARIPQDPQQFEQFKQQAALGATKFIEQNKPHVMTQDLGGSSQVVSTPGLGGAPQVLSSTPKTETPGQLESNRITMRGQDMTDARQRELNGIMEGQSTNASPSLIKSIASGEIPLNPPPTNARNPIMLQRYGQMVDQVKAENPNWSAEMHPTIKKTVAAFATGPEGKTVKKLNTATDHLETIRELVAATKNGNVQLFNKVANQWAANTGNPAPSNLAVAAQVIGGEIVGAIVGAGGGVGEREKAESAFSNVKSPADAEGAINTVTKLMGGQFKGMKQQYEAGTYGRKDFEKYLSPAARKALEAAQAPTPAPAKPSGGIKFLGFE